MARANALGVASNSHDDGLERLAVAYADLFVLNVYPYGTVYTDARGEINTPAARRTAALYEAHDFQPPDLSTCGAPDHLGLCLAFLAYMLATPGGARSTGELFLSDVVFWAPVCCQAVERDPTAHEFYRALARYTGEALLSTLCRKPARSGQSETPHHDGAYAGPFGAYGQADDEVRLRDIVRFLLSPSRCGLFISRARLGLIARSLGLRLPFGSRFEVAEWLFNSAGQNDLVPALIAALRTEADAAEASYTDWAERWPEWRPAAAYWLEGVSISRHTLLEMESLNERGSS